MISYSAESVRNSPSTDPVSNGVDLRRAEVARTFDTPAFRGKTETLGEFRYKKIP